MCYPARLCDPNTISQKETMQQQHVTYNKSTKQWSRKISISSTVQIIDCRKTYFMEIELIQRKN